MSINFNCDTWMGDLKPLIENKKLSEIAIPGAHDSGAYNLSLAPAPDHPVDHSAGKSLISNYFARKFSEAQFDVYKQLTSGGKFYIYIYLSLFLASDNIIK